MFYDIHALFTLYVWSILGFTFIYYIGFFPISGLQKQGFRCFHF